MVLQNEGVRLQIDDATGAILQLEDLKRNRRYIAEGAKTAGQVIRGEETAPLGEAQVRAEADGLEIRWQLADAVVNASVRLLADGAAFRASVQNGPAGTWRAVEYPVLGPLTDYGGRGCLAHAWATGVLVQNPAAVLPEQGALRFAPYPEGFSGASMQLMSYYEEGRGGLYLAAQDGGCHQKWLNAWTQGGALCLSHMAGYEDLRPGAKVSMDYDFVVRFTDGDGWEEAAGLYKAWATEQEWCREGTAAGRADRARWLYEDVGYCTFGVNAGSDRTKWLNRYRRDIGAHGFHVLGPDWTNRLQDFQNGIPGAMEDWLPTRFNAANLRAIRENGDRFAPFEFDFLVGLDKSRPELLRENLERFPSPTYSHDGYTFNMLCPCQPYTRTFHRERDLQVLREAGVDAMYYDISANNLIKICEREDHAHTPGGGCEITRGYQEVYEDTRAALTQEAGREVPLGTEMMCECFLPQLSFYQARAWAQPCAMLETWPLAEAMRDGRARMIPMFDSVYHEYGPVRMDGWGKLVEETGDLFYYNAAKVYSWGGLYEINHDYSPMELLEGAENDPQEHYFRFQKRGYAYAPERAAYLRAFARARTGLANPYWAYGTMLRTPRVACERIRLPWFHYNYGGGGEETRGSYEVEAVFASCFRSPEGSAAVFLTNVDGRTQGAEVELDANALGAGSVLLHTGFDADGGPSTTDLGMLQAGEVRTLRLELSPRTLYMLKIKS